MLAAIPPTTGVYFSLEVRERERERSAAYAMITLETAAGQRRGSKKRMTIYREQRVEERGWMIRSISRR